MQSDLFVLNNLLAKKERVDGWVFCKKCAGVNESGPKAREYTPCFESHRPGKNRLIQNDLALLTCPKGLTYISELNHLKDALTRFALAHFCVVFISFICEGVVIFAI